MSKSRKIMLLAILVVMILLCFHPAGRMFVKFLLPLGFGILDLIGTGCLLLVLAVILFPDKTFMSKVKRLFRKKPKKSAQPTAESDEVSKFIFELTKRDNAYEFVPIYMKVIDIGEKRNNTHLVVRFIDYYGKLTIKFLDAREDLSKHNLSVEINNTTQSISQALESIKDICNNFISKMLTNDLLDIETDIEVLGVISHSDNLL